MPFVEVTTREELSLDVREHLAQALSDAVMSIEIGRPSESGKPLDWMWFHTVPADHWAVGGRFDNTYVRDRKMALGRIIAPQGLMNPALKQKAVEAVGKCLKDALGLAEGDDDTGIWVTCSEVTNGNWGVGDKIPSLFQLLDTLGGDVSDDRRKVMEAVYPK